MKDIATLAISPNTLCRLLQYADAHPSGPCAGDLAALAIEEWLARADDGKAPAIRRRGYQWKTVFLPEGTQLRAWNRSGFAYAEVVGDSIIHLGHSVSPHEFICRCKGISRSAWAEVVLLFPGENQWKRADAHRRDLAKCPVPRHACTPTPMPTASSPPSPRFSTVLPSENTTANPQARTSRLPRVAPIPTQARHQQVTRALAEADRTMLSASNRRQGARRQEDLLLD